MKKEELEPVFKEKVSKILKNLESNLYNLYDLATKDEKTGIYNHRFFDNLFSIEIEKAKRGKQELSIIIIDIDFFKKFNDTYGHLVGDRILKELAQQLQSGLRKYDLLARFGGEEFFILLPETSKEKARKVASRLRRDLHKNKQLKKYNVTISLGVTSYKERDSKKRMIKRADKALYKAKSAGRNRVEVL
ncbi:MAG: GGDEF domain-containing protein [Candidatus Nanoarchaeia archaeon]